jgi:hypothetical protein
MKDLTFIIDLYVEINCGDPWVFDLMVHYETFDDGNMINITGYFLDVAEGDNIPMPQWMYQCLDKEKLMLELHEYCNS